MISKLSAGVPALLLLTATPALAQGEQGPLDVNVGLMIWTVLIFVIVLAALAKFAWPNIIGAVEKREEHIRELIAQAERDRAESAALTEEHRRLVEETRGKVQEALADARNVAERTRTEILDQARREHDELLARARAEMAAERASMVAAVRADAAQIAMAAAEKLVQRNLDSEDNRRLVLGYLAALDAPAGAPRAAAPAAAGV